MMNIFQNTLQVIVTLFIIFGVGLAWMENTNKKAEEKMQIGLPAEVIIERMGKPNHIDEPNDFCGYPVLSMKKCEDAKKAGAVKLMYWGLGGVGHYAVAGFNEDNVLTYKVTVITSASDGR